MDGEGGVEDGVLASLLLGLHRLRRLSQTLHLVRSTVRNRNISCQVLECLQWGGGGGGGGGLPY